MKNSEPQVRSGTQVIARSAQLLKLITTYNRTGMRLIDLYQQSGLTRPTAHRMLQALVAEGLVRQDRENKRYFLGPLVYEMGLAAAPPLDLRDICQPFLQRVAVESGDTVFLTIRSGLDGVCIARAEGAYPIKAFVFDVGRRRPLNVGGGAITILSGLTDDEIERIWMANKERTLELFPNFDYDLMWSRIHKARNVGYLVNDVLEVKGIRSVAVPILGPMDRPLGALSISALRERLDGEELQNKVDSLRRAIHEIHQQL